MNSTSFWLTATGALPVNISLVVGEFARTGWQPYPPLSESRYTPGVGVDYFILSHGRSLIWEPALSAAITALAIAQIGVHLVFFLHITTSPDSENTVLALGFGVFIVTLVVGGSLWIMYHLDRNMLPSSGISPF